MVGVQLVTSGGQVIAEDIHPGYTGHKSEGAEYHLSVPQAGTYHLRYWVEKKTEPVTSSGRISLSLATGNPEEDASATVPEDMVRGTWVRKTNLQPQMPWKVNSVIGLFAPGQQRRSFLSYIEREKPVPYRTMVHYNDWYEVGIVLHDYAEVIGVVLPEILPMVGFEQHNEHHCHDVWGHTVAAIENSPPESVLRWAALFHDIGKPDTFSLSDDGVGHFYGHPAKSRELAEEMLRRLKCSNDFRETVVRLVDWHDREIQPTEQAVGRALRRLGETDLRRLLAIKRADNRGQAPEFWDYQTEIGELERILDEILASQACFSLKQLAVNGNDLVAMGYRRAAIGALLEQLLEQVVDGELPNEREALLGWVKENQDA